MKKIIFTLFIAVVLSSCNNNDSNSEVTLIGNWKLIAILADPGDGSGVFTSVESEKTMTFENNGTVTSNGNLCDMSISSNNETSGTYSNSESTFNSFSCNNSNYNFKFEQTGNILIVIHPCIEACKAKFIKE